MSNLCEHRCEALAATVGSGDVVGAVAADLDLYGEHDEFDPSD